MTHDDIFLSTVNVPSYCRTPVYLDSAGACDATKRFASTKINLLLIMPSNKLKSFNHLKYLLEQVHHFRFLFLCQKILF